MRFAIETLINRHCLFGNENLNFEVLAFEKLPIWNIEAFQAAMITPPMVTH